ncbi:MAG TPA: sensor domain-containing diguanylate cyclase, partial [Egibacteraceae bacterium]|nr:sensor domain-containing diguanylate cyclase [Egibacteraceae bacterium]
ARLEELSRSRDQLRQSLSRLGQTLSSSLDLNRTLAVVVETAMDTFEAERGALLLFTPERDALYVKVGRNLPDGMAPLRVDEGVAGWVARTGTAVRLPADAAATPAPAQGELVGVQQITVPLLGRGRTLGVLSLTRDAPELPFSADDLDAIQTFAGQASGAIENVMLHHEARRLSVTDALTGLWNFRYLQLQAERELESSERFDRPMSLLICDLDHFKSVNDEFGHQVGDDVLVEVAARLRDATRVPDVVARYGGEEFVVLLPGTDPEGAAATAERIRAAVADVPVTTSAIRRDGHPLELQVTCSVGVATHPRDGRTVAALLRSADAAMYNAKRGGRNRVVVAAGGMAPSAKPRKRKDG